MPEWLKTVIAGAAGGLISGGFLLLADYLRHTRFKKERFQSLLVEKRVAACGDLMRMLRELEVNLSPTSHGAWPLSWPYYGRDPRNLSDSEIEHAKRVDQRISELGHFVSTNEIVLGSEIIRAWHPNYGTLMDLRVRVQTGLDNDGFVVEALLKLLPEFVDEIAKAIKKALRGADIEFVPTHEWQALRRRGQEKADQLIADVKSELEAQK
jgi:hypothetical protein